MSDLYETDCSSCEKRNSVAYVPANDPEYGPLGSVVIKPVCRRCLDDYLHLLELSEETTP